MNMCTVAVSVRPEAERGPKQLQASYLCRTGGMSVQNCAHYKALVVNGLKCHYECRWFRDGCTCRKARQAAKARAAKLLSSWTKPAVRREN